MLETGQPFQFPYIPHQWPSLYPPSIKPLGSQRRTASLLKAQTPIASSEHELPSCASLCPATLARWTCWYQNSPNFIFSSWCPPTVFILYYTETPQLLISTTLTQLIKFQPQIPHSCILSISTIKLMSPAGGRGGQMGKQTNFWMNTTTIVSFYISKRTSNI